MTAWQRPWPPSKHYVQGLHARLTGTEATQPNGEAELAPLCCAHRLTPFLSWVRDFDSAFGTLNRDIHFFHPVRGEGDVMFWDEIAAAEQRYSRFRPTLTVSSRDGSLTMDKITAKVNGNYANTHVYLCGPVPMTEAFRKQFSQRGVPRAHIHFEEFNFR